MSTPIRPLMPRKSLISVEKEGSTSSGGKQTWDLELKQTLMSSYSEIHLFISCLVIFKSSGWGSLTHPRLARSLNDLHESRFLCETKPAVATRGFHKASPDDPGDFIARFLDGSQPWLCVCREILLIFKALRLPNQNLPCLKGVEAEAEAGGLFKLDTLTAFIFLKAWSCTT